MPVKTIIQKRRDTAVNWTSTNPILAAGEEGFETDTRKSKVGNGSAAWTSLAYSSLGGDVTLTGTQTLTNKSLTAPWLNDPNLSGLTTEFIYPEPNGFAGYVFYAGTYGSVICITGNSTANGVINLTRSSTESLASLLNSSGQSMTAVLMITNGATAYYPTAIQLDGAAPASVKWAGGTAPTSGNANAVDIYTFTIVNYFGSFRVFASVSKFA